MVYTPKIEKGRVLSDEEVREYESVYADIESRNPGNTVCMRIFNLIATIRYLQRRIAELREQSEEDNRLWKQLDDTHLGVMKQALEEASELREQNAFLVEKLQNIKHVIDVMGGRLYAPGGRIYSQAECEVIKIVENTLAKVKGTVKRHDVEVE